MTGLLRRRSHWWCWSDFGAYWGHRAFHNVSWLWLYHAVHHSVPRLWYLNTGRIHPVDSALMMVCSMVPLYVLGAPDDMVVWLVSFHHVHRPAVALQCQPALRPSRLVVLHPWSSPQASLASARFFVLIRLRRRGTNRFVPRAASIALAAGAAGVLG